MNRQSSISENHLAKPFLKWAGGKKRLLPVLLKYVPTEYNNYYEPFLGSGALFFTIHSKKACLSDMNEELINTYIQIRDNVEEVICFLKKMKYDKKSYYRIRPSNRRKEASKAARFIYLNKTCWNGLYRVNKLGEFNVPMGRYKNPTICNEDNLRNASKTLRNTKIQVSDFEKGIRNASKGDLIYFDPPYITAHNNNSFIKYNKKLFSMDDQRRLSAVAENLRKKGCKIIISNAAHESISRLYKVFEIKRIKRKSLIAGKKECRKLVNELIITNF